MPYYFSAQTGNKLKFYFNWSRSRLFFTLRGPIKIYPTSQNGINAYPLCPRHINFVPDQAHRQTLDRLTRRPAGGGSGASAATGAMSAPTQQNAPGSGQAALTSHAAAVLGGSSTSSSSNAANSSQNKENSRSGAGFLLATLGERGGGCSPWPAKVWSIVLTSVVDTDPYSGAIRIRIRIRNTDPDPHM